MGSIVEYGGCGCGGVTTEEFDCNSLATSSFCSKCGEFYQEIPVVDENGDGVYETRIEAGKKYKELIYDTYRGGGFGVLKINYTSTALESRAHGLELLEDLTANPPKNVDMNKSFLYLYDKETFSGKVVWGEGRPQEDDDYIKFTNPDMKIPSDVEISDFTSLGEDFGTLKPSLITLDDLPF